MAGCKTTVLCDRIAEQLDERPVERILVVGCGDGSEAAVLADYFDTSVIGIDLAGNFAPTEDDRVDLRIMNAEKLEFDDDSFDLVYSFHALEHIEHPELALAEMRRVLAPDGMYCIGVPNRSRLVGYIGSRTPLANKIRWNLADLGMRLRGRWHNSLGAHAGYSSSELRAACEEVFGHAIEITDDYYRCLYPSGKSGSLVNRLAGTKPSRFVFPCVYFVGRTHERASA